MRLVLFDFREIQSSAIAAMPPESLTPLDYTEDDPADLLPFRGLATQVIAGAATNAR